MESEIRKTLFRHDGLILVEYEDGTFGIRRDGVAVPGCRWDSRQLSEGVRAFRDMEVRMLRDADEVVGGALNDR